MARYVDGFVVPVTRRKLAAYRSIARKAGRVMRITFGVVAVAGCSTSPLSLKRATCA